MPITAACIIAFLLRPWRLSNLIFGLLLPVVPLALAFDSIVSNLRTYTVDELRAMVASIDAPDFAWEVDTVPVDGMQLRSTYLLGWRRSKAASDGQKKAV
jgi:hypothetical protein